VTSFGKNFWMSSERGLWTYLREGMKGRWHVTRHEDMLQSGIPDVSYGILGVQGWIELKQAHEWPKRGGALRLPHLSAEQRHWLTERGTIGNRCWILLQVEQDYFLLGYPTVFEVGESNKQELIEMSHGYWSGTIVWKELARRLFDGIN
jgi:hypothetical protein